MGDFERTFGDGADIDSIICSSRDPSKTSIENNNAAECGIVVFGQWLFSAASATRQYAPDYPNAA